MDIPTLINNSLAYIPWDPNPDLLHLSFLPHPVKWYGLLFAGGLLLSYWLVASWLWALFLQRSLPWKENCILDWKRLVEELKRLNHTKPQQRREKILTSLWNTLPSNYHKKILHEEVGASYPSFHSEFMKACNHYTASAQHHPFSFLRPLLFVIPQDQKKLENRLCVEYALSPYMYTAKAIALQTAEKLAWYIFLGTLIGARLGHALFYEWDHFIAHPLDLFKIWEGGLASHGGVLGILIAIALFWIRNQKQFFFISWIQWMDMVGLSSGLAAGCIRIGNFINQEILGTPTDKPWAILFLNPLDNVLITPRHPVQLYEAAFYFCTTLLLTWGYSRYTWLRQPGVLVGLIFSLFFSFRFIIEFLKVAQGPHDTGYFHIGQWLSLPLAVLGVIILYVALKKKESKLSS